MKAIEVRERLDIDGLTVVDKPTPEPGPKQVRLRMKAWSLNFRDLMVVKGQYNPKLKLPYTPLSDGVGVVDAVGDGVSRVKVGDRVAGCFMQRWCDGELTDTKARSALGAGGQGMLAEFVVLDEDGVVPVPAHLTDAAAATLPCAGVTAWNALMEASKLRPSDTVLIQGTGGVSIFALQFARSIGAHVLPTSSSDDKLARVHAMGAMRGINYKTTAEWGDAVRARTGFGVDQVVEVGGAGTLNQSLKAVKQGGRISLIGVLAGRGEVNPLPILMRGIGVQGIFVGSRAMFENMNRAIDQHQIRPVVDRVFAFDEIRAALRHMESGAHFGKVCIAAP